MAKPTDKLRQRSQVLKRALIASARIHHTTQRLSSIGHANTPHWQHCLAPACTAAFTALVETGFYRKKHIEIRRRNIQRRSRTNAF